MFELATSCDGDYVWNNDNLNLEVDAQNNFISKYFYKKLISSSLSHYNFPGDTGVRS